MPVVFSRQEGNITVVSKSASLFAPMRECFLFFEISTGNL